MRISDWSSDVCSSDLQDEDNIPAASGSPDASLTQDDSFTATSHAGLTYPWGEAAPGTGETIRVADGISWARIPMPGSLGHINSWLLDDADGVARSEEHTSELQSLMRISYAVFCLKKTNMT